LEGIGTNPDTKPFLLLNHRFTHLNAKLNDKEFMARALLKEVEASTSEIGN
jgi:hypothetical protein